MSNQTCDTNTDPSQSAECQKSHRQSHMNQYLITDLGSVMHSFIPWVARKGDNTDQPQTYTANDLECSQMPLKLKV